MAATKPNIVERDFSAELTKLRAAHAKGGALVTGVTCLVGAAGGALVAGPLAIALPVVALAGGAIGLAAGAIEWIRKPAPRVVVKQAAIVAAPPRPKPAPPPPVKATGPSPAAIAAAKAARAKNRAAEMKAAAAHVAVMLAKPKRDTQPADILTYIEAHNINIKDMYPEWPWIAEGDGKWHCDYDFDGDSNHVHWYTNGYTGYQHNWGGTDIGRLVGQAFDDIENVAQQIGNVVGPIANLAIKVANVVPWELIADGIEAATSVVPVLGTAVADYVATIETIVEALKGESSQEIAFRSAYNYLMATTPGAASLRPILDPVVEVLVEIINGRVPSPKDAIVAATVDVPAGLPRQIAASLAATVAGSLGIH